VACASVLLQMTLTQTTKIKLLQCYTTPSHIMAHGDTDRRLKQMHMRFRVNEDGPRGKQCNSILKHHFLTT